MLALTFLVVMAAGHLGAQTPGPSVRSITYEEARPVIERLGAKLPPALAGAAFDLDTVTRWNLWLTSHRSALAARLERGDDDSVVNLWLYGTSFTSLPPVRPARTRRDGDVTVADLAEERLEAFVAALATYDANERLQFARAVLVRRGIDVSTRQGRDVARQHLRRERSRAQREFASTDRTISDSRDDDPAAQLETHSTIFRDRGLSSDTSILIDFALERALATLGAARVLPSSSVRRVAIVGPGLDFINKADGHDFYPQQSIQPFAVVDTLLRLGLADADALRVTTLDVSDRVNAHLNAARSRAERGDAYPLTLPLPRQERWTGELRSFWQVLGGQIGASVRHATAPEFDEVEVRSINVRPDIASRITPVGFDIVTDRFDPSAEDQRFDLVIATNVFVYYDPFEQALAGANVAAMLRPGGILLSNNDLVVMAPMKSAVGHLAVTYSDRQNDNVFVYQRQ